MAEIILVVGGTRSGKSDYALRRGEAIAGSRCFLATCRPADAEMNRRVARHRAARDPRKWTTVEEPFDLAAALAKHPAYDVYLIDCLTLWISNILGRMPQSSPAGLEDAVAAGTDQLLDGLQATGGSAILVSSEVGMGVVPENRLARLYRDLLGRCNQQLAGRADEVVLVSCGLPLWLKTKKGEA